MSRIKRIGIIAEDDSDIEVFKVLIKRIANKERLSFKKNVGDGCGRIKHKALKYANDLHKKGCDLLIFVHDLDRNKLHELKNQIDRKLDSSSIQNKFVCIPIEELEAWFLSDLETIRDVFKLTRIPNIKGNPEKVSSPKETLEGQVYLCSNKERVYLNTNHNKLLASKVSIELMREKCTSFALFYDFLQKQTF